MIMLDVTFGDLFFGPPCQKCGSATRLVGEESHPVVKTLTLFTFACSHCESVEAIISGRGVKGHAHAG
jgi:hypothetical protein